MINNCLLLCFGSTGNIGLDLILIVGVTKEEVSGCSDVVITGDEGAAGIEIMANSLLF